MNFASTLRQHLSEREMTPLKLAASLQDTGLDVSVAAVTHWITGRNEPRLSAVRGICKALHITPNDLLGFGAGPEGMS